MSHLLSCSHNFGMIRNFTLLHSPAGTMAFSVLCYSYGAPALVPGFHWCSTGGSTGDSISTSAFLFQTKETYHWTGFLVYLLAQMVLFAEFWHIPGNWLVVTSCCYHCLFDWYYAEWLTISLLTGWNVYTEKYITWGLYEGPRDLYFSYRQSNQLLRSLLPDWNIQNMFGKIYVEWFTDNFPNVTNFSRSSVDRFSTIFPKILYFNFDRKPYKWFRPSIRKCIIQPIRFKHFAYKHAVRQ